MRQWRCRWPQLGPRGAERSTDGRTDGPKTGYRPQSVWPQRRLLSAGRPFARSLGALRHPIDGPAGAERTLQRKITNFTGPVAVWLAACVVLRSPTLSSASRLLYYVTGRRRRSLGGLCPEARLLGSVDAGTLPCRVRACARARGRACVPACGRPTPRPRRPFRQRAAESGSRSTVAPAFLHGWPRASDIKRSDVPHATSLLVSSERCSFRSRC